MYRIVSVDSFFFGTLLTLERENVTDWVMVGQWVPRERPLSKKETIEPVLLVQLGTVL